MRVPNTFPTFNSFLNAFIHISCCGMAIFLKKLMEYLDFIKDLKDVSKETLDNLRDNN